MPFKKGQSGNPNGRSVKQHREANELQKRAKKHTRESVDTLVRWMRDGDGRVSVAACTQLLDRGYGKPAQTMEGTGKNGEISIKLIPGDDKL